ncbi:outer membrane beta-barrel protein [Candidatus Cardinium hertigii]|jgi:hypothetical protein|uniref:PorT family protein n=1 Tax=Candidatus Cardinium hertigii TaxID=247481 RepID=A0A3N2QDC8_9BACT|nr:outer membrane beta-barrel protein [Candidatus Cardinium hertigii]ROT47797.1 PorT family protein [Candidatus Cardinium hertigii]
MKGIRKTLVASVLAYSTALHAQAEVNPFSAGIKAGGSISPVWQKTDEAKFNTNKVESPFFDIPWFTASLYAEYAFTDYIGIGGEAGYMKQGGTLNEVSTTASSSSSSSIAYHGIFVPLSLYVYPMGREEEEGILKVYTGINGFYSFNEGISEKDKEASLTQEQKNEIIKFDVGGHLGLAYEFPIGVSVDLRGGLGFINKFDTKSNADQKVFKNVSDLKSMKSAFINLNVGYNIVSLFADSGQA